MNPMRSSLSPLIMAAVVCLPAFAAGRTLSVRDFGAKGDGSTDDTEAIVAAVAAVRKGFRNFHQYPDAVGHVSFPELLFPAGMYLISRPIDLDHYAKVRGEGYAVIRQKKADQDIFITAGYRVQISGICFQGGLSAIRISTGNLDTAHTFIEKCQFYGTRGFAIHVEDNSASTLLKISECVFLECEQVLLNRCDHCIFSDSWITTARKMKNKAAIENLNLLICDKIIGVPLVNGQDQRWIDNYGMVTCRNFRFGGEGGGFTPVVNFARRYDRLHGPMVVLDACHYVCAWGNAQRRCAVYCEQIPNQIVIRNSNLSGIAAVIVSPKIDLKTYFDGVRPGMLRFEVSGNVGEFAGRLPAEMIAAAARRNPRSSDYGDRQLSPRQTREALAAAIEATRKLPPTRHVTKDGQHARQADPAKFVEITTKTHTWDLSAPMDGTNEENGAYLVVGEADGDTVIVRRMAGAWPHAQIRDVQIDLDRFPYLCWQNKDNGLDPAGYAIRVVHNASGRNVLIVEKHWPPFFDYHARDLRKAFELDGGVHSFDIKFYFLGVNHPSNTDQTKARKGDALVIDFLRCEAE